MKYKNDDLEEILNRMDGEQGFNIFTTMVSLMMAGHWRDRLDIDGIQVGDSEAFEDLVARYLRNIRLRAHANRYLKPKIDYLEGVDLTTHQH